MSAGFHLARTMSQNEGPVPHRRSLFQKTYSKKGSKKKKNVSFSPYARCLKLEPQSLSKEEESKLWWQKSDYEEFARVGRTISKAMLEGGSEVWLTSKSPKSTSKRSGRNTEFDNATNSPSRSKDDTMIDSSSSSSSTVNQPLHHGIMSEHSSQEFYEMRNKWWHKFGHSRRGLEHIASRNEGRQRLSNCRSAIRSVMEEQKRQMMFLPKGYADVEKFRTIYRKETRWAGILAHAAGESDADAVKTNFDESCRKPREYYLKKHLDINGEDLPAFMKDTISPSRSRQKLNLDANTVSQICFRKSKIAPMISKTQPEKHLQETSKHSDTAVTNELNCNHDDSKIKNSSSSKSFCTKNSSPSLAKMAAGWGGDEAPEDMSAVLIGMGVSTRSNRTVG